MIYSAMQYKFGQIMNPDFATEYRKNLSPIPKFFKPCGFQCIHVCEREKNTLIMISFIFNFSNALHVV